MKTSKNVTLSSIAAMESCARVYEIIKPCTFRQRLALAGHAKQNQRVAKIWCAA